MRDAKGQAFYLDGLAVRFRSLDSVEGFGQHSLNTTLAASAASAALEDSSAAPPSPGGGAGGPIKVDLPALREYGGIDSRGKHTKSSNLDYI